MAFQDRANGPALAAVLAAGIGTFVLGLLTTLAEVSASIKEWLTFRDPVGALSGKTSVAVAAWAVSWIVFGLVWRKREIDATVVIITTAILIGLGFLGTFPTFFERFATG